MMNTNPDPKFSQHTVIESKSVMFELRGPVRYPPCPQLRSQNSATLVCPVRNTLNDFSFWRSLNFNTMTRLRRCSEGDISISSENAKQKSSHLSPSKATDSHVSRTTICRPIYGSIARVAGHACDQKKLLFSFQFPFDILTSSAISLCRQPAAQREFSEKEKACGRGREWT